MRVRLSASGSRAECIATVPSVKPTCGASGERRFSRVINPPETPAQVQRAIDAGLATWDEITAALRELGLSEDAIAEWRAGDKTVGEVVVDRVLRGLD